VLLEAGGDRRQQARRNITKLPWAKYRCQPFVAPFRNDVCGIGVKLKKMALGIGDIVWQEPFVCPRVLRYFPARYRLISTLRPMFRSSLYVSSTGVI
jgi:hypothetical protein